MTYKEIKNTFFSVKTGEIVTMVFKNDHENDYIRVNNERSTDQAQWKRVGVPNEIPHIIHPNTLKSIKIK